MLKNGFAAQSRNAAAKQSPPLAGNVSMCGSSYHRPQSPSNDLVIDFLTEKIVIDFVILSLIFICHLVIDFHLSFCHFVIDFVILSFCHWFSFVILSFCHWFCHFVILSLIFLKRHCIQFLHIRGRRLNLTDITIWRPCIWGDMVGSKGIPSYLREVVSSQVLYKLT